MLGDDDSSTMRRSYHRVLIACLALLSTPIVLMYLWLLLASVNRESLASFLPTGWTLQHWRFLWVATVSPAIWSRYALRRLANQRQVVYTHARQRR
jgi:membrane protein implicated in regulation of membrane protease activity